MSVHVIAKGRDCRTDRQRYQQQESQRSDEPDTNGTGAYQAAARAAVLLRLGGFFVMEHADVQGSSLPAALRATGSWRESEPMGHF